MTPEKRLWQEVIIRAVLDALWTGAEFDKNGRRKQAAIARDKAAAWFEGNSEDYREVCDRAGFDPDFLRKAFMEGRIDLASLKSMEAASELAA